MSKSELDAEVAKLELEKLLSDDFYERWRRRDEDHKDISECVNCKKSYHNSIWEDAGKDPRRWQLQICRVCFYDLNKNLTPELELLFKLVDKQKELNAVEDGLREAYDTLIKEQRTPARIELDAYQKEQGVCWFGPQPRPEGFVGGPEKSRIKAVFGLDMGGEKGVSKSKEMIFMPPTIILDEGGFE